MSRICWKTPDQGAVAAIWHLLSVALCLAVFALPGAAQQPARQAQQTALMEALEFAETIEIMQAEGAQYGALLAADMLPDADPDQWDATIKRIYSAPRMLRLIEREMTAQLDGVALGPLVSYFKSSEGQHVVALELAARRVLMDPEAESAAMEQAAVARGQGEPIFDQIDRLIADSDLVTRNVEGALNANLRFLRGLGDGGASQMSEADMVREVRGQADANRAETEAWMDAFLLTAYHPLDAKVLDRYARLYRTPEGRALNRAMFVAFNQMYEELSYQLGRAVAQHLTSTAL